MSINPADVKIILAEDAKTMRKSEVKILNSLGYTDILEAEDGLKAKKLLQNRKGVSLIIADWNMPNMGGDELLVWVRQKSKKFKEIPFIMATAQSDKAQANKAKESGVTSLVAKPFTAEELQAKIEQALDPKSTKKKSISQKARTKSPAQEQVSLSQLLFDKGISLPNNINPDQLQTLADDLAKLAAENNLLKLEITDLKEELQYLNNTANTLFKKGVQFLKDEQLFEAAGNFNAVLALDPENMKALNNLAVIYYEMEMFEAAKETFKKILQIDPENEIAQENLADLA